MTDSLKKLLDRLFPPGVLPSTPPPGTLDLKSIERGIIFVHASWSGPSHSQFTLLIAALEHVGWIGPLFVFDTDELGPEGYKTVFGRLPHGAGETFFVRDGTVAASNRHDRGQQEVLRACMSDIETGGE